MANAANRMRLGHVALKVADLARAIAFYRDVLGFTLLQVAPAPPSVPAHPRGQIAFLSLDGTTPHLALNTYFSLGGTPPGRANTGLWHVAFAFPDRRGLAAAYRILVSRGIAVRARDHGNAVALYLDDPDGNNIELYYDRPSEEWRNRPDGTPDFAINDPFDPETLLG